MTKEAVECGRCKKYFIVDENDDYMRINGCPCRGNNGKIFETIEEAENSLHTVFSRKKISVQVLKNAEGKIYLRVGKGLKQAKYHSEFVEREITFEEAGKLGY